MKFSLRPALVVAGMLGAWAAQAQQLPAEAPAGTTVQCKDGNYASPDSKTGACRGHKGIKTWFGKADAKAAAAASTSAAPASAPAAATAAAPAATTAKAKSMPPDPSKMMAAAGGGAGKVWANDETQVYHCVGDRYYGKTKKGEYMTEADAKAKGMHPSHNKACS